jgi:hypothetical protein
MIRTVWLLFLFVIGFQNSSFGQTKHCLFIGDSYFSHNDLSKEFLALWNVEASDSLFITNHNRDGSPILSQWRYNSDELLRLFASQKWDYVIIELTRLSAPQDSGLLHILHEVDSSLRNCRIICIPIDFCHSFPEMACSKDAIEGVRCNEFLNCQEKLTQIKAESDNIVNQKYQNSIEILPFAHYQYFLDHQYSIKLGSDDEYGHPSIFSQSVLARFILFGIMNKTTEVNIDQTKGLGSEDFHLLSFYNTFYHEDHK